LKSKIAWNQERRRKHNIITIHYCWACQRWWWELDGRKLKCSLEIKCMWRDADKMYVKSCNYLKWKLSTNGAICLAIG